MNTSAEEGLKFFGINTEVTEGEFIWNNFTTPTINLIKI
jgi:hypothetical protein